MTLSPERLSKEALNDFDRNRDGRLSTRQWLGLISEPLTTLLLLSVPVILLFGRYGYAGRLLALALISGFGLTIFFRALRFARVKLHYGVLFLDEQPSRWKIWRKLSLSDKYGESVVFDKRLARQIKTMPQGALQVYFFESAGRRVLLSTMPQAHPKADLALPSDEFLRRGGTILAD